MSDHYDRYNGMEELLGTDLISRAAAQTELQLSARRYTVAHEAHGEGQVVWSESLISVSDAMDTLRKIPSSQPKKGKWIYHIDDLFPAFGIVQNQVPTNQMRGKGINHYKDLKNQINYTI